MPPTVSDPATSQSPTVWPACHHVDGAAGHNRNRRPPIAGSRAPVARQSGWEGGDDQERILTVAAD
jgi:hypothetical protein